MINESKAPYSLDWGTATAEGYRRETKQLLHVFKMDLSSTDNMQRCTIFIIGRIAWFCLQAPPGSGQIIRMDMRGQDALLDRAEKMKTEIISESQKINPSLQLTIEIIF